MNIDFYSYSGLGGRPVNEDSCIVGNGCYIVSDGLGGHDNGELASGAATRYISENFAVPDLSNEYISGLILGANEAVKQHGEGGKATLAALFTDGNIIRIDNIGDSRIYYFRGGKILFRTKDHSVCQASVDMGEMTDIDVRNSPDRSGLFKVLGDSTPLKLPKPYDLIEPINADAFLICSDGFWENIYEAEMEADLLKSASAKEWLDYMLKRHFLRAQDQGDNFTAICGIISSPKTAPLYDGTPSAKPVSDIPSTIAITESAVRPSMPMHCKIIVAVCAFIAVAAVSVAVTLLAVKKSEDIPASSPTSESQSAEDIVTTEKSTPPEESAATEVSEISESIESSEESTPPEVEDTSESGETSEVSETTEVDVTAEVSETVESGESSAETTSLPEGPDSPFSPNEPDSTPPPETSLL